MRILHYAMWCEGEYHCGLGRIDQYLLPYYDADIQAGRLTAETALEEMQEFFIACNRDSDLYPGMQQGDNGQSSMLGGVDKSGKDAFNALSRLLAPATPRALSQGLTALGKHGLVTREVLDARPPASRYDLTGNGALLAAACSG